MSANVSTNGFAQPPQPKQGKGPIILVITGVVVGLVSLIVMLVFLGGAVGGVLKEMPQIDSGVGSASVQAKAEDKVVILGDPSQLVDARRCYLVDGHGDDATGKVRNEAIPGMEDFDMLGVVARGDWTPFGAFVAQVDGTYTLKCDEQKPVALAIIPLPDTDTLVGAGIGIVVSLICGFVGFALFIAGIIWLIVRHVRRKQAASAAAAHTSGVGVTAGGAASMGASQWQTSQPGQWQQNPSQNSWQNQPQQNQWQQGSEQSQDANWQSAWEQPTPPNSVTPTPQVPPQPQPTIQPQWTQPQNPPQGSDTPQGQ